MTRRLLPAVLLALAVSPAAASTPLAAVSINPKELAPDVSACENFDAFVNRRWVESNAIPGHLSNWGTGGVVRDRNTAILQGLLDAAVRTNPYPAGSNRDKVVAYYRSGLDTKAIEAAGLEPARPLLEAIDALRGPADLPKVLALLHRHGIPAAFNFTVAQDPADSRRMAASITQGGLGLPDRDYYLEKGHEEMRGHYRDHVKAVFALQGAGGSPERSVLEMETALATGQMTAVERRDPRRTTNRRTVAALAAEAPGFDWKAYFAALGAAEPGEIVVGQPAYLAAFAKRATEAPTGDWQAYLRWHVLHSLSPMLPRRYEALDFAFFKKRLTGTAEEDKRERRVIAIIAGRFGEQPLAHGLGEIFVGEAFPPESKARAAQMVGHIKAALRERLSRLDWMEEATRKAAIDKLDRMGLKIGYPDRWRDFSKAEVGAKPFAANWLAAARFDVERRLAQLGRPVDRADWWMSPHILNAYYSPRMNEIVFPAGILQPPFFDPKADDAVNFGAIGSVIGHEITHGFDDSGRRYDADGNLRDWWTAGDDERYRSRADAMVAQYGQFRGVDGIPANGRLTLGENISDLGGLVGAYAGLQRALQGKPRDPIDGFTPEQRFFLAYAVNWRTAMRPEEERLRLRTGNHSLPRFRVLGPLANMAEFAQAFSCQPGQGFVRAEAERVVIW